MGKNGIESDIYNFFHFFECDKKIVSLLTILQVKKGNHIDLIIIENLMQ